MNASKRKLMVVDTADLPEYPIPSEERLDSHYFIQWNLKRWRKSYFRRLVEPEVGWFGFLLICESQDESPIGTLPLDERLLANTLGVSLDRWRQLCEREITPLHGWYQVRCDTGEIRYGHRIVQKVALEALKSKRKNQEDTEQRRLAKRLKDLREMVEKRIGAGQLLKNPSFLESFNDWLEDNYPDSQRREPLVRRALDEFQMEMAG
ncbi:hypothetical protein GCM10011415_28220 [Salipiger pallidus]|uniref:Uncharacterized protein n=1 Tax=Salipiger pallidus TaxID=1775170 RepID=A0A8J3EGN5_9RHOB|nr:hypothetical protein [Salipiger pallidus]GGG77669.1 hypothetical protein GCM10011415_28220 [Salipiger pallidus]